MTKIFPLAFLLVTLGLLDCKQTSAQPAKPFVHPLLASHMVLQRDAKDPIWGWTQPGETVTAKVLDQTGKVLQTKASTAAADGRWQVNVGPFGLVKGNAAYSINITDGHFNSVEITDVLVGDVWMCSGQSNMARSLITHQGIPDVFNQNAEIADTIRFPQIRQYYVGNLAAAEPQSIPTSIVSDETGSSGPWLVNNPVSASAPSRYSAVAYFFARELNQTLDVPIGIIQMTWGGTSIQGWIDPATLAEHPDFAPAVAKLPSVRPDSNYPAAIYNGKIAPIIPFRFKGVVWYQGENNAQNPEQYGSLLPLLQKSWRKSFAQPSLPFLIIQLPNFENTAWPVLREAQLKTVLNDSHSRLVMTIDLGDAKELHPPDKQDVAHRAALSALNLAYGQKNIASGPLFMKATRRNKAFFCSFSNVGAGLMVGQREVPPTLPLVPTAEVKNVGLTGFEIAGKDGQFVPAKAVIVGANAVKVSSPNVTAPISVRYGWAGAPICNLYNKMLDRNRHVVDGLPASPFRFTTEELS